MSAAMTVLLVRGLYMDIRGITNTHTVKQAYIEVPGTGNFTSL